MRAGRRKRPCSRPFLWPGLRCNSRVGGQREPSAAPGSFLSLEDSGSVRVHLGHRCLLFFKRAISPNKKELQESQSTAMTGSTCSLRSPCVFFLEGCVPRALLIPSNPLQALCPQKPLPICICFPSPERTSNSSSVPMAPLSPDGTCCPLGGARRAGTMGIESEPTTQS